MLSRFLPRLVPPLLERRPARTATLDLLTAFGLASVGAMLACYALEDRSPYFVLAFALACWAAAAYGWLTGAWPFTLIEAIWGAVALRRFVRRRAGGSQGVLPLR
jgi:hypothetical protein